MICILGFICSIAAGQELRPEPVLEYAQGLNSAKAEQRPLLILVTQKVCPACKPAFKILDDMRLDGLLGKCIVVRVDSAAEGVRAMMIGKKLTPQILVFDFRKADSDGKITKHGVEKVDRGTIEQLIGILYQKKD